MNNTLTIKNKKLKCLKNQIENLQKEKDKIYNEIISEVKNYFIKPEILSQLNWC